METQDKDSISEKISSGIKSAIHELEELRVQLSLGKMEARDLFEQNKKKFQTSVQELKQHIQELKKDPEVLVVLNKLEHFQVQLELGKSEAKQFFEQHYAQLSNTLNELEKEIRSNPTLNEHYARLHLEVAKFKLKLELFALHFKLKKLSIEYDFEKIKSHMHSRLSEFMNQVNAKKNEGKAKWEHFQEEIKDVYDHLKKSFHS